MFTSPDKNMASPDATPLGESKQHKGLQAIGQSGTDTQGSELGHRVYESLLTLFRNIKDLSALTSSTIPLESTVPANEAIRSWQRLTKLEGLWIVLNLEVMASDPERSRLCMSPQALAQALRARLAPAPDKMVGPSDPGLPDGTDLSVPTLRLEYLHEQLERHAIQLQELIDLQAQELDSLKPKG